MSIRTLGTIYVWGRDVIVLLSLLYGLIGLFTGIPFAGRMSRSDRSDSVLLRIFIGCGIALAWPIFLPAALYSINKRPRK